MKQNVRRWLYGAGALAAVGAMACSQGMASASTSGPRFSTDAATPAAAAYVPPSHDLYYGNKGAAVKSVERRLNQLHYYAGPVDGVFGQDLEWAVWAFKRVNGLPMNVMNSNLVGPNSTITWAFRKALVHPKTPFALVPKGGANRVEINLKRQYLVLYKNNKPHLILDISSGGGYYYCNPKPPKGDGSCGTAVTEDGNYHAAWFQPGWDQVPLGYMYNPVMYNTAAGQAMHGGDPVPWYPASHGCVRLQEDVENWFHKQLTVGGPHATPVYVRGTAPYELSFFGQ
jgi:peptidoglycan hydrolase-like protein with peptidoglycan-binding domain